MSKTIALSIDNSLRQIPIFRFTSILILIPFKTVGLVLIIAYHYQKIKKGFINVNEISFDIFE